MGRIWVLDTETKGTGAHMAPLEDVLAEPPPKAELALVPGERRARPAAVPEPGGPKRFKVVDALAGELLGEDVDVRRTIDLIEEARSLVDVRIYVWEKSPPRWRLLTLGEQKAIWALRRR